MLKDNVNATPPRGRCSCVCPFKLVNVYPNCGLALSIRAMTAVPPLQIETKEPAPAATPVPASKKMSSHVRQETHLRRATMVVVVLEAALVAAFLTMANRDVCLPVTMSLSRWPEGNLTTQTSFCVRMYGIPVWFLSVSAFFNALNVLPMFAIMPSCIADINEQAFHRRMMRRFNHTRWIDYFLTSTAMVGGIALLSGISDGLTLFLVMTCMGVTITCGAAFEYMHSVSDKPASTDGVIEITEHHAQPSSTHTFWLGMLPFLAAWAVVGCAYQRAVMVNAPPQWVSAIVFGTFLMYCIFPCIAYAGFTRRLGLATFEKTELAYIIVGGAAKLYLAGVQFGGSNRL